MNYVFKDRIDAGKSLATSLKKYRHEHCVVLALPRGGVPVGFIVAEYLHCPLDIILSKKIGHPFNKEYAIGAATLSDYFISPHEKVLDVYIQEELKEIRKRLKEMNTKYLGSQIPVDIEDKIVIIVDDGIATGNSMIAAITLIKKSYPKKIVIAVPVSAKSTLDKLMPFADEIISLISPFDLHAIGDYYENFQQVTDEEVIQYLEKKREKLLA